MEIVDGKIKDYLSGKWIKHKPEEEVRQVMLRRLCIEYGYPKELIRTEFTIQKGSKKIGPADIVVLKDDKDISQHNIIIIVELKRKERSDGEEQLKTYLSPCKNAKYGVWYNGNKASYIEVISKSPYFKECLAFPKYGQTTVDLPKKSELVPAVELNSVFEICHNHIYANQGLLKEKVFNEVLKLIFIKMIDEKSSDQVCKFGISTDEEDEIQEGKKSDFTKRITGLFERVQKAYPDIFDSTDKLILKPTVLGFVVGQLQNYSLINTKVDVKGTAFQTFVYAHQRGERGEYFTPHAVVELCVDLLNPKDFERISDPACGSGGFLIQAMQHVWCLIDNNRTDLNETKRQDLKLKYANDYVRGCDINPDLAKVAKMHMILYDDGHAGICSADGLISMEHLQKETKDNFKRNSFDVILTNPPFGSKGKVKGKNSLKLFNVAYAWKKPKGTSTYIKTDKLQNGVVPDVLFVERCIDLLNNEGRLAIVLPNGDLNNITLQYLRQFIFSKARVLGVVSLPVGTFKSAGANPQSSILFLQKETEKDIEKLNQEGYEIFMAVAETVGYDLRVKTAPPVYWKLPNGEPVLDKENNPILDTHIPKITELFQKFLVEEGVSFLSKSDIVIDPHNRKVKHTIVNSKALIDRLDALYYTTKRSVEEELANKGFKFLTMSKLGTFPKAKTPKREEYTEVGIPVLKLKNIKDDFIELEGCDYVHPDVAKTYFVPQKYDILITATGEGTIGRSCIVTDTKEWIVTGEVMVFRPNIKKINPYYLLYYLRSSLGKSQLIRFSRGSSGQTHLYSKDVRDLIVPIPSKPQQEFYEKKYLEANALYSKLKMILNDTNSKIEELI
jgi:type I restriction enzyme M protein